jgi:hypothetical protein
LHDGAARGIGKHMRRPSGLKAMLLAAATAGNASRRRP